MLASRCTRARAVGRPPDPVYSLRFKPRPFTCDSHLFRLVPSALRPQVPFLYSSSRKAISKVTISSQVNRFLSTQRKARWKQQARWQIRFQLYVWGFVALLGLAGNGIYQVHLERKYPTPHEWSIWSRWSLRVAQARELEPFFMVNGRTVNWDKVASCYQFLLDRLQNLDKDGRGLAEQDEGGIFVDGIGRTGFDISLKSESWRRGYYQTLMGIAKAAEHLDGFVRDRNTSYIFPEEVVIGPSNPRPRPQREGARDPPKEEDCDPACENPQVFYMRIMTTKGFNSTQRIDAALAYADWLDFKGMSETAESMYQWALDIVAGDSTSGGHGALDLKSGILDLPPGVAVSQNMLKTCTAVGVHQAARGNVEAALPIFLSVLKARKNLPLELLSPSASPNAARPEDENSFLGFLRAASSFFREPSYPQDLKSGDQPAFRSLKDACEETGLMTYIGEILYATSSPEKGMSWTRDAVDATEDVLWRMKEDGQEDGIVKCQQCLQTGLGNWKHMVRDMSLSTDKARQSNTYSRWFNLGPGKLTDQSKRWEEEEAQVELRIQKMLPLINSVEEMALQ